MGAGAGAEAGTGAGADGPEADAPGEQAPEGDGGGLPDPGDAWADVTPDAARRLLVAAIEAFAERGYHATTTRDIASRAGMSPAALYIHYRTKEELLFQISKVGHQRALALLESAAGAGAGDASPAERLGALVRAFVRWHAERHTTARVVQYELHALSEEHYAEVAGLRRATEQVVRQVIEDGVAAGDFDVADVPGAALAVLSLCIDVARWFNVGGRRTPEEVGDLYADLVLRMVRPERAG
ncbi:TetR family transcriptional regulator [Streptomyces sp. SCUT-3]|uniref:TetR/AcrR family transcriptional regulator n=1 Tax=Streptomyces sp. SCUT-3 TaxID=2684469 RepID=UPI0015F9BE50|nr:TetR/AcrR family transcriptional regulator [Streptomyces sp. SCUT-3]QMV24084.1 TetR family transcriptional regulator [Streptomyces sp. SCUT-3]